MTATYSVCVGVYVAGLLVRDGYELLKKAGRIDSRDGRVFAMVFASMCLMWVAWFGMGIADPSSVSVPMALRWASLGAVIIGTGLALGGVWQLRGVENIDHLETTRLFARIRHPMYVGFVLWILGWSTYRGAFASLAIGSLGLISILWWRHLEERELKSRYGDAYEEYCARTWL